MVPGDAYHAQIPDLRFLVVFGEVHGRTATILSKIPSSRQRQAKQCLLTGESGAVKRRRRGMCISMWMCCTPPKVQAILVVLSQDWWVFSWQWSKLDLRVYIKRVKFLLGLFQTAFPWWFVYDFDLTYVDY